MDPREEKYKIYLQKNGLRALQLLIELLEGDEEKAAEEVVKKHIAKLELKRAKERQRYAKT